MLTAARLSLKQHRFEIAVAAIAAVVLSGASLLVASSLRSLVFPTGCLELWRDQGLVADGCGAALDTFASIEEGQAAPILAAMAVLPFALGLLGGVPVVGRELEARTVQVAWSLSGSRSRWLLRQLAPVVVLLGAAILLAAVTADALETTRQLRNNTAVSDMTLHGAPVVARAYGAFGLGLLLGALLGRTLPAFVIGILVSVALVAGAGEAHRAWLMTQTFEPVVVSNGTPPWAGSSLGVVWIAPDGRQIEDPDAVALVPPGEPDTNQWLLDRGYKMAELVLSQEAVLRWINYDVLLFVAAGSVAIGSTFVFVNRRRPTY